MSKRAFDRISRFAGQEHLLRGIAERAEEIRERRAAVRHREIHLGGPGIARAIHVRGEVEIAQQAVHEEHGALEAVVVLVAVGDGVRREAAHLVDRREDVVEAGAGGHERVAAAQRRVHQRLGPDAFAQRLPELVAAIGLDPFDAGLAAAAPLDHALDGLEAVKIVAIDAAVADAERLADARAERHLDLRSAPRHGQARSRHEREFHLARRVVHLASPSPNSTRDACR